MNRSGHYVYQRGQGFVKVSDAIPALARPVYVPKGDLPHYDASARRRFESKAEKRAWLKQHGLREGGLITNPDKRWEGPTRNASKPTYAQRAERQRMKAWVASQGGAEGLLNRLQRKEPHV